MEQAQTIGWFSNLGYGEVTGKKTKTRLHILINCHGQQIEFVLVNS